MDEPENADGTKPEVERQAPDNGNRMPRIPGYDLVRPVASGGMGVVFEAMQHEPRRRVAIKIIKSGFVSLEMLRRFRREGEVLGRLHHPGIATIYQIGTYEGGTGGPQPFFAMEFIEGGNLLEYCAATGLDVPGRIALLIRICDAVQHAHANGVIHRDLKPDNILVDGTGQPKILDFGVALLTEAGEGASLRTESGVILGSLAYMSPEQVTGNPGAVDKRADVYALGVIGFELLAGRLPIEVRNMPLARAAGVVANIEPDRLSSINKRFRGDLETIIGKALEKDKTRRYSSAESLATDLCRYISNEPIEARPPSATYQLRKFAARNRVLATGVVATFTALVLGIIGIGFQAAAANRARRQAEFSSARAEEVAKFLIAAIEQANPGNVDGATITARQILDQAAGRLKGAMAEDPAMKANLLESFARSYLALGENDKASEAASEAAELIQGAGDDERLARLYLLDGRACRLRTDYRESEASLLKAIEALARLYPGISPQVRDARMELARTLSIWGMARRRESTPIEIEKGKEATKLWGELAAWTAKLEGQDSAVYGSCIGRWGGRLLDDDLDSEEGERLLTEGIAIMARHKVRDKNYAALLHQMASVKKRRKDFAGEEAVLREEYEIERAHPWSREYADCLQSLSAAIETDPARSGEAEVYYREWIAAQTKYPSIVNRPEFTYAAFSTMLFKSKKYNEATEMGQKALDIVLEQRGVESPNLLPYLRNLRMLMALNKQPERAESLSRDIAEKIRSELGEDSPKYAEALGEVAQAAAANGNPEAAAQARSQAKQIKANRK